jgi:hypothetical protein
MDQLIYKPIPAKPEPQSASCIVYTMTSLPEARDDWDQLPGYKKL